MFKYEELTKQTNRAIEFFEQKLAFTLGPVELKNLINDENINIIDVRQPENYNQAHIPNAISIPGNDVESHLDKLSKDKINIIYCYTQQCHLAAKICLHLAKKGYPVMELEGGFDEWHNTYHFEIAA